MHIQENGGFAYNKTLGDPNDGKPATKSTYPGWNKDWNEQTKKKGFYSKYTGIKEDGKMDGTINFVIDQHDKMDYLLIPQLENWKAIFIVKYQFYIITFQLIQAKLRVL